MANTNERMVQFELLRIFAMFGVVMNHVFNYGLHIYGDFRVDTSTMTGIMVWTVLEMMKLISLPSVNCYILISGYFLIEKTQFRLKGMWNVWSTTWFYAVGIYLLAVVADVVPFSWSELGRHATPLLSNSYWFVTSYVVLLLLAPFLSWGLQKLSKRQYQMALLIGGILCFQPLLGQFIMDGQQLLLFVYLFMIGGYIRLHADRTASGITAFLAFVFILLSMYVYTMIKNVPWDNTSYMVYAMPYHGLVLPLSVALFFFMKHWHISSTLLRRLILTVAPLSFAVYIIHTQSVVDTWLWRTASGWLAVCHPYWLPFACFLITLLVFLTGVCIEYLRSCCARLKEIYGK